MSTLALVLLYESILLIVAYAGGEEVHINFGWIPMSVIIFTILLKLSLYILCKISVKSSDNKNEIIEAYG